MFRPKDRILIITDKDYSKLIYHTIGILTAGTVFYHFVENLRWIDGLYFSVVTLTTIGYGDFTPQTDIGKIFTIVYIFYGLGVIFAFMNMFFQHKIAGHNQMVDKETIEKTKDHMNQK
jgi:voltage-gated potassium channel